MIIIYALVVAAIINGCLRGDWVVIVCAILLGLFTSWLVKREKEWSK